MKIKSALPPPPKPRIPPPPLKREFYGHGGFPAERRHFFQVYKIGAAISGPRIADTNFTDTRIFLNFPQRGVQWLRDRISGFSFLFLAIAVFSACLSEGIKTQRSLRKERKTQKPSLISKEKVNKAFPCNSAEGCTKAPLHHSQIFQGSCFLCM